jgi:hypothetical protein
MLDKNQLSQEAVFLINGKLEKIEYVDSFQGNEEFAKKFNSGAYQVFITNSKEL